jgi:hypothetical protein
MGRRVIPNQLISPHRPYDRRLQASFPRFGRSSFDRVPLGPYFSTPPLGFAWREASRYSRSWIGWICASGKIA